MKMKKALALVLATLLCLAMLSACGETKEAEKTQTLTLEGGYTYEGETADGLPNGQGTLTDAEGSVWSGTFVNGKLNGYGTYEGYDFVEYEGTFVDGVENGYGTRTYANGDVYKGEFQDGIPQGVGKMEFTTGCFYEGDWDNGTMSGLGWMTWPVGDAYFGEWRDGNITGFGCKVFYDPTVPSCVKGVYSTYNKYVGEIVNNLPQGMGVMFFQGSGGIYYGNFEEGIRNDENAVYYFEKGIDCVKFEGAFSAQMNQGWIWGEGTMWYSDGTVITGTWEGTECVNVKATNRVDAGEMNNEIQSEIDALGNP